MFTSPTLDAVLNHLFAIPNWFDHSVHVSRGVVPGDYTVHLWVSDLGYTYFRVTDDELARGGPAIVEAIAHEALVRINRELGVEL